MMLLILASILLATTSGAPSLTYEQQQDGEFNVRADLQNILLFVAVPQKLPDALLNLLMFKSSARTTKPELQNRSDTNLLKTFAEPNTPYQVDIGAGAAGEGRNVEVVITGHRRLDNELRAEGDEYKLLGALEQCGPDRERDPVTLTCRKKVDLEPTLATKAVVSPPEVITNDKVTAKEESPAVALTS